MILLFLAVTGDASETLLQLYEGNLALIRQTNPNYCSEAQVPECILPTTTIESSPFTFVSSTISSMSGASSTHIQIISPHTTRHSTAAGNYDQISNSINTIILPCVHNLVTDHYKSTNVIYSDSLPHASGRYLTNYVVFLFIDTIDILLGTIYHITRYHIPYY